MTLVTFIESIESILDGFGAECVMTNKNEKIYQIPENGAIIGKYGDPLHINMKNNSIKANASIGYLGMKENLIYEIADAFFKAGYSRD